MRYKKRKKYFVGIDSDGTVFDSMKIKHTNSFIPAAVEVWNLDKKTSKQFKEIEERINLYSMNRGINRFPGLLMSFEELGEIDGLEDFKRYINSDYPLSNAGLAEYMQKNPSVFLDKVMAWSELSDRFFSDGTKNLKPFRAVSKALCTMHAVADIMVVSAASSKGLAEDWGRNGLLTEVDFTAGQEFGSKKEQLLFAKSAGYEPKNMLMIGDAPGDYEAAKAIGCCFYPIVPDRESKCWELLQSKYIEEFLCGKYYRDSEAELYCEFVKSLNGGK